MADILTEKEAESGKPSLLPGFKSVCVRLGLMMVVVYSARILCDGLLTLIAPWLQTLARLNYTLFYFVGTLLQILFLDVIPIISAVLLLKFRVNSGENKLYGKPRYFGKALKMFPAGYAIAIAARLLTMLLGSFFENDAALNESFNGLEDALTAPNLPCAIIMFVQLAVVAPICEEFWFRGVVMESLRPYGNGFAIFVSALLFGLTHANFEQFFYATVLGIFLGYIAISTQSIVTTTIIHAMFNSLSGVMMLLATNQSVGDYVIAAGNGEEAEITPMVTVYIVWLGMMLLLMAVGFFMAIYKLIKIKKYRVPKVQTELSAGRRWGIFFTRISVIVMLLLAADTFTYQLIPNFLENWVNNFNVFAWYEF